MALKVAFWIKDYSLFDHVYLYNYFLELCHYTSICPLPLTCKIGSIGSRQLFHWAQFPFILLFQLYVTFILLNPTILSLVLFMVRGPLLPFQHQKNWLDPNLNVENGMCVSLNRDYLKHTWLMVPYKHYKKCLKPWIFQQQYCFIPLEDISSQQNILLSAWMAHHNFIEQVPSKQAVLKVWFRVAFDLARV